LSPPIAAKAALTRSCGPDAVIANENSRLANTLMPTAQHNDAVNRKLKFPLRIDVSPFRTYHSQIPVVVESKESGLELSLVSCSARLQAGIRLIPKCPPEGGRYNQSSSDDSSRTSRKKRYHFAAGFA
jgi:hypothetical protein